MIDIVKDLIDDSHTSMILVLHQNIYLNQEIKSKYSIGLIFSSSSLSKVPQISKSEDLLREIVERPWKKKYYDPLDRYLY